MARSEQLITRYLLGELTEPERTTLEESYFNDSRLFEQLQKAETDLLDDYARGRLSSPLRQRLERRYLGHPELRCRLRFAEALVARVDAIQSADASVTVPLSRSRLFDRLRTRPPALVSYVALAAMLFLVAGVWFLVNSTARLRQELSEAQAARTVNEGRQRDLQRQVADEQARADQLASELDRLRTQRQAAVPGTKSPSSSQLVASLLLVVGGLRSPDSGPPATLTIPPGAAQARLQLRLKENEYPRYTLILQAADGQQAFKREGLLSRSKQHPSLVLFVPTSKLPDGDYLLALKGVTQAGETEDVSKSLFRVKRK